MNKLIVTDVPGLDGTYEFEDFTTFTNRELHRIKKLTDLRVGEFEEAFRVGDNDILVGLAVVVLEREGKKVDDDLLWDAPAGTFVFEFDAAADPTQASATPSEPSEPESIASDPNGSGDDSSQPSDSPPANGQSPTGLHDLPRSATYDRPTSVS